MLKRPKRPIDRTIFGAGKEQSLDAAALDTPERILAYCRDGGFIVGVTTNIQGLIEENSKLELVFRNIGEYDAYIEKIGDDNYRIVINNKHSTTRQRFSMAHEYVHYQLHRNDIERMPHGERILFRSEDRDVREYQANQIAAEILMPESDFKQVARARNGEISVIGMDFQVSPLAVRFRAKTLEIAGHGF